MAKPNLICKNCGEPFHDSHINRTKFCGSKCSGVYNSGETHYGWKGDDVGISALHTWIKCHKPYTGKCEECGVGDGGRRLDAANISQEYKRDVDDFRWLCRRCHMKEDGRLARFRRSSRETVKRGCLLVHSDSGDCQEFDSRKEATEFLGAASGNISRAIKRRVRVRGYYVFSKDL